MAGNPVNEIKSYNDIVILYGYALSKKTHSNHAVKIIIAEKEFSVSLDRKLIHVKGVIVRSDTPHKIKATEGWLVSIFIDPQCHIGNAINVLTKRNRAIEIEEANAGKLFIFFYNALHNHLAETEVKDDLEKNLLRLDTSSIEFTLDKRIEKVIKQIKSKPDVKFADLLSICELSESRLIHLFKKETGTNIRRYILWCRIQRALRLMAFGSSLKQSARQSGFTDAAHFSRTFVSMHGIAPSLMLK
jgi:AraC-like DNA-binding protein